MDLGSMILEDLMSSHCKYRGGLTTGPFLPSLGVWSTYRTLRSVRWSTVDWPGVGRQTGRPNTGADYWADPRPRYLAARGLAQEATGEMARIRRPGRPAGPTGETLPVGLSLIPAEAKLSTSITSCLSEPGLLTRQEAAK